MQSVQYDREIIYVQKLYFFLFLLTFLVLASLIVSWRLGLVKGLLVFGVGLIISYIAMLRKKVFIPPARKITVQRMAKEISQDSSPLTIARFASQQYFYLHEPAQAISLLEKYLSSRDPLLYATLGDILLREGRSRHALSILRENPYALTDPLLLAAQGHVLQQVGKFHEAIRMYERCLRLAKENGFVHNGANRLTQFLLTISYTASIHHSLGDCYLTVKDFNNAKKHYRIGNFHLIDLTYWRKINNSHTDSTKNYTKSH